MIFLFIIIQALSPCLSLFSHYNSTPLQSDPYSSYILGETAHEIIEKKVKEKIKERHPLINGAIVGILFFIAIYNLGFYFAIKDITFLWYVCFQFLTGLTWLCVHGYPIDLFFPHHPEESSNIIKLSMVLMALSFFLFTKTFLRLKYYLPKLCCYMTAIVFFSFTITALMSVFSGTLHPLDMNTRIVGGIYLPFIIVLGFYVLKKGFIPSKYFLAAQLFFVFGALCRIVIYFGLLPVNSFTVTSVEYGSVIEAVIFSVGLRNRHQIMQAATAEKTIREYKHRAFSSQINAHFIFNSLSTVQKLITSKSEETALSYLSRFAKMIRLVLENSHKNNVYLADELKMITSYLEMEQLRFNNKFNYTIYVDPAIDVDEVQVPALLVHPFIENSIIHGFSRMERGLITISFNSVGTNGIQCIVEDNGIGRVSTQQNKMNFIPEKQKSLGIELVIKRLELLINDYSISPVEIIDIFNKNNEPAGTKAIMSIPIHNSNDKSFNY